MEYLYTHRYESDAAALYIAVDRAGAVHRVAYHDFRQDLPSGMWEDNKYACGEVEYQLEQYFRGDLDEFSLSLAMAGTDFQHAVWKALRKVTYGTTISYGELARKIGCRNAARAVGSAVARNPVAVIVPCHRVVRASGASGHYALRTLPAETGQQIKRRLLEIERNSLPAASGFARVHL